MVTGDTAIQVAAVYACCRLITDCIAPAPINVVEVQSGGKRKDLPDDPIAWTLNKGANVAVAPDAPAAQAVEEALFWAALTHGDGYAEIQRDLAGRFFALWPIEPTRVTPRRDGSDFYYEVAQPEGGTGRIEPVNMFHLHGPSLFGWTGDSIVYRAAKAIGIAQAAQVYAAAYYANGTVISGLLTSDKTLTQEQANKAKERWAENHGGGPGAQHGISVLGQGLKWQQVSHNAQESQLVEARRFQVAEVARFFGVPLTLLADNEAWTNLGAIWENFYRQTLRVWASRFDQEASRKIVPWKAPWREIEHDLTAMTLGSFAETVKAARDAVEGGIWTRNEARALFGKNSVADGDVLVVGASVKSLEDALDPPEPVAAPAPKPMPGEKADPEEPEDDKSAPVNTRPSLSTRDALVAMFADAFSRHARRIKDNRPRSAAGLAQDCAAAWALAKKAAPKDSEPVDLAVFADALEQGEPPDKAAERLVSLFWMEAA